MSNRNAKDYEFMKPIMKFHETILKEFIERSEDKVLEFKQCLIDEKVFIIPKVFNELRYIFNGLVAVVSSSNESDGLTKYL